MPRLGKSSCDLSIRGLIPPLVLVALASVAWAGDGRTDAAEPGMVHRMMLLVLQLGVILYAARAGHSLFLRLRLPGALGELAAGVALGPFALGQVPLPGLPHGLFAPVGDAAAAVSPELYALATIAAILLLFNVGLETDLKLLIRYALAGSLVGIGGLAASFVLGAGTVMVFSRAVFGEPMGLLSPQALLLGTITTATSVGITARILSQRQKLDSPEGVTILAAAVIDDVLGIILLAIVMSVVTASRGAADGVDWARVGIIAAKAVGVWVAATVLGLLAARRISFLLKHFRDRTTIAVLSFGLALILAGVFEGAGLAMIIGAYVMGLALSKADISNVIHENLAPVSALLVPVFFAVTGMQIDLSSLASPAVLGFGLAYAVVALAAKLLGCGLPAMLADFNLRGAARIGFGMAPRGEIALIIAGVGLTAGYLEPAILSAVVIMILINTVLAPVALAGLFRSPKRGTRSPEPEDAATTRLSFDLPSEQMTTFFIGELRRVFEEDGFFVHLIRRRPPLYQLRRDGVIIELRQRPTALEFTCPKNQVALVNAAMNEALAGMERTVRCLQEPLDPKALQADVAEAAPAQPHRFKMGDYLSEDLIQPHLSGRTKDEIIEELVDLLCRAGKVADRQAALDAVLERERSLSTGLQRGVAIPHGKTDAVGSLVCAVGLKPEGVDFDSLDGQPSRIFVLTLSPKSRPAPHVQFMSAVAEIVRGSGRDRLLECETAREVLSVFTGSGGLALGDYLRPELCMPRLKGRAPEEVIRELIALLDEQGLLLDPEAAATAVLEREAQMSTAMEHGVAIPHGRTDAVQRLVCAVGVKREGLDFNSIDGQPTRIVMLVLTPTAGADPYLQLVASIVAALDEPGRRRVLAARTPRQLCDALTRRGGLRVPWAR
jgi:Kef-type K+ transport system membrane component KefB/mannitol/fructose-specific phosphotransferase system IIA component (Ntr-type)